MEYISIDSIKHYTAKNMERITSDNALLQPISESLRLLVSVSSELEGSKPISDEVAAQAIKFSATDSIPEIFTEEEVNVAYEAASKLLDVAVAADDETSKQLAELARYLHPLLSQDSRTEQIGWDLEEYIDWYFTVPSREERKAYARELLSDWQSIKR